MQNNEVLRPSRSFFHSPFLIDAVDELGLRITQDPVDHRHGGQNFEHPVGLRPDLQRGVGEIADGDHGNQRRVQSDQAATAIVISAKLFAMASPPRVEPSFWISLVASARRAGWPFRSRRRI